MLLWYNLLGKGLVYGLARSWRYRLGDWALWADLSGAPPRFLLQRLFAGNDFRRLFRNRSIL